MFESKRPKVNEKEAGMVKNIVELIEQKYVLLQYWVTNWPIGGTYLGSKNFLTVVTMENGQMERSNDIVQHVQLFPHSGADDTCDTFQDGHF